MTKLKIEVVDKRNIYFAFSILLILFSLFSIFFFGLKFGTDLIGGSNWQLSFEKVVLENELRDFLTNELNLNNYNLRKVENVYNLRLSPISEEQHQFYLEKIKEKFAEVKEISFSSVGPTIGFELRKKAVWAIILVLIFISLYIAFAFRKSSFLIKSYKFGLVTLLTLFHDVFIAFGFLVFLGYLKGVEIDTNMIVALLLIMGFSVHDTIVVFDRIREKLFLNKNKFKVNLKEIVDTSVNETLARSINTSLTFIFTLLALIFFGPVNLVYFCLVILVGTIIGTYSSIFIASPLLYLWAKNNLQN